MTLNNILLVVVGLLVATLAIYMTPLRYTPLLEPSVTDVDPAEFYELYKANPDKYVFVDVRSLGEYTQKHAEGSQSMPLHTLYDQRKELPMKDKEIVLICTGGRASGVGYSYLEHYGFSNISRIEGGIDAWADAGLPVNINIGI